MSGVANVAIGAGSVVAALCAQAGGGLSRSLSSMAGGRRRRSGPT